MTRRMNSNARRQVALLLVARSDVPCCFARIPSVTAMWARLSRAWVGSLPLASLSFCMRSSASPADLPDPKPSVVPSSSSFFSGDWRRAMGWATRFSVAVCFLAVGALQPRGRQPTAGLSRGVDTTSRPAPSLSFCGSTQAVVQSD
jgi:hypothetical protein